MLVSVGEYEVQTSYQEPFKVGDWRVEPALSRISRNGEAVPLRPLVMGLLVYLSEHRDEIASVDQIVDQVWKGAFVSNGSVYNCINELRERLGDNKRTPVYIETIPKRGYRLIAEVGEAPEAARAPSAIRSNERQRQAAGQTVPAPISVHRWLAPVAIALALLVIGGLLWTNRAPTEIEFAVPESAKPRRLPNSIAVLPFDNLSSNQDDAFFASGIYEEILNQLSKIKHLAIIARTSTMQYANADIPIQQIAKELNVETVMEGTVRYAGDRVRITAQLIDGATGAHLWSETYDRELTDIFAIESDIAANIMDAMQVEFSGAEKASIGTILTASPDAYAHYVKALSHFVGFGPTEPIHAELDAAIELDPDFAAAMAVKAVVHGSEIAIFFGADDVITPETAERDARQAESFARRALALDPEEPRAYLALGLVDRHRRNWVSAFENAERAYRLNPSHIFMQASYAERLEAEGRLEEAERLWQRLVELDPQNHASILSAAHHFALMEKWELALQTAEIAAATFPDRFDVALLHARIALSAGDRETAKAVLARAEELLEKSGYVRPPEFMVGWHVEIYEGLGRFEEAKAIAVERFGDTGLPRKDSVQYVPFLIRFGRNDEALDHIHEIIDGEGTSSIVDMLRGYSWHSFYDGLRGDPRFEEALDKIGAIRR